MKSKWPVPTGKCTTARQSWSQEGSPGPLSPGDLSWPVEADVFQRLRLGGPPETQAL